MIYQLSNPIILTAYAGLLGILVCLFTAFAFKTSPTMKISMILLPPVVCAALLAINGSLGTGIAILGVFGLVRFRSMPGTATDILAVFYAMVTGLIVSTGYVFWAAAICLLLGAMAAVASRLMPKEKKQYMLKILVSEELASPQEFEAEIKKYCRSMEFERLKTASLGTMYELSFIVEPKEGMNPVEMIDAIRVLNHNLNVSFTLISQQDGLL